MSDADAAPGRPAPADRNVLTADGELTLLRELIQAASSGPGVEPLAAAAARMITAATGTDVCFVHVLDDTEQSLTLAGATPPFDSLTISISVAERYVLLPVTVPATVTCPSGSATRTVVVPAFSS